MNIPVQPAAQPSVTIPMVLADKLFACYYGAGPRHPTSPGAHQPTSTPTNPPPTPDQEAAATERLRKALADARRSRMIPRGTAPGATPTAFPDTMSSAPGTESP